MREIQVGLVAAAAILACVSLTWNPVSSMAQNATTVPEAKKSSGWPNWRGPNHDNVVADGTRVAVWGDAGPLKLWESPNIPGGQNNGTFAGGVGSPAVSGDRVYVYATSEVEPTEQEKVFVLTEGDLKEYGPGYGLGWSPTTLPDELSKSVEAARASAERGALKPNEVSAWVQKTKDALMSAWADKAKPTNVERNKYLHVVNDRLVRGPNALPLDVLDRLATIKDRIFKNQAEVDKWFDENHIAPDVRNKVFDRMHHCINPQDGKIFWRHNDGVTGGMTLPEDTIYCLDAADGKIVWKHVGKRGYFRGAGDGPGSCTPCVADGRVYVLHVDGLVYCLNAKDGAEIWTAYVLPKLDLPRGKYGISFGGHGSIVVLDGLAIVQAGMQGPLMAFDAATGALAWTRREAKGWHSTPTPWVKDGRIYLICNNRDGREVYCADIHAEGKVLWTTRVDFGCFSSPAVSGDSLVFYSGKTLYCYRMSLDKVEPLWNVRIRQCDAEPSASPLIYKNRVYVAGLGLTLCVNLEDGKVLWEGKTSSDDQSSVLLADDKLIIQCWGDLSLLNAAPDKFELLAKVKMPGQCQWASPAIANGRMYLRFNNGVRCFDVSQSAPAATPGATPAK